MIRSFRDVGLRQLWENGRQLPYKTLDAIRVLESLDVIEASTVPQDAAFIGFRYDEWTEGKEKRYGIMVSDHWLISFGWSDGHAIDVDLERIE